MSSLTRKKLVKWLERHEFEALPMGMTSHLRFEHPSGVVVTVPGHGRAELSKKHVGMLIRDLESAGFERKQLRQELG